MNPVHARQTPIIRLLGALAALLLGAGSAAAQERPDYPCVSCLILQITPELLVTPGQPALQEAGVTLAVTATPGATPPASPGVDTLVLEPPGGLDPAAAIFATRTFITEVRAARPGVRLALDGERFAAAGVPVRDLIPYVDAVIGDSWRRAPDVERPSVEELTAASLLPGGERVVVRVGAVDPAVVAAFAARRAAVVEVEGTRPLSAEEIVARHQAQRRRQEARVARTIAHGASTLLFEVPGFVAPVTISARTTIYAGAGTLDLRQADIRVNGAAIAGGSAAAPPRLPLVDAERLTAQPLTITLTDAYTYRLDGRDAAMYRIDFAPRRDGGSLARGRAWIDAADFSLRRLHVVQSGLRGAIVASEQVEEFAPFDVAGEQVWLPVRTRVFQMYEGAGHRTPIHRTLEIDRYEINPADFDAQVQAAFRSDDVMLRETPQGLRYLVRADDRAATEGERVIAPSAGQRIRTLVMGMLIDPNISGPLPFAGLSYVDLDLFETGAQVNAFFGGTYGQLSWSVPSVGRTRWQLHGRAFGIAVRYNDRAFRGGVEHYAENIRQRPAHVSMGALRPLSTRVRLRTAYELDVTTFARGDTTASDFVVPASSVVHGMHLSLEAEAGPWTARGWWNPAVRQGWRAWGREQFDAGTARFHRYGAVVTRTLALGPAAASRVEAGWMGGHDLDRFSRYSFNSFDNRLHGYPTASLRYDRGAVVRTATAWNGRGWRLDAFADAALVRDPGFGDALRGYPGVGAAVEVAAPYRTLVSVEWGYGFKARQVDGGYGTHAVRVTGYRVF